MLLKIPALILASSLAACASHPAPFPVDRQPAPALLEPCDTPDIPPAVVTSSQAAKGWIDATRIALDCGAKFNALAYFVTNAGKTSAPKR